MSQRVYRLPSPADGRRVRLRYIAADFVNTEEKIVRRLAANEIDQTQAQWLRDRLAT